MTRPSDQTQALRLELMALRRRAASRRAIAATQRRQAELNRWANATIRTAAADRRKRADQARQDARAGDRQDPGERERLADLRDREADKRERLANLRDRHADDRERLADRRDRDADHRDRVADLRDIASDRRDQVALEDRLEFFRRHRRLLQPARSDDGNKPQHNGQSHPHIEAEPTATIDNQSA